MKYTSLANIHMALGAKMAPFAGYYMPIQYTGIQTEHEAVRNAVGVFDVSHMGEFILKGEKALDLIQKISSNDAAKLFDGKVQYSCLPNETGGIVDDLLIYRINAERYMLVVNAANIEKDWRWISHYNQFGVSMENISAQTSLLAVQGPYATRALRKLTDVDLAAMEYYTFKTAELAGVKDVLVSATGYTGAGGFELYFDNQYAEHIWKAIFEAGQEYGIQAAGLAARDTLRLEMGFCLYGNDIDDTTSPIEGGLGWITKFNKDFVNSSYLLKQKQEGVQKKLVGFEMLDRGIPRNGYAIVNALGEQIGRVTSGTQSPSLQKPIGMGYVEKSFAEEEKEIYVRIRQSDLKAKVVKTPFYKIIS